MSERTDRCFRCWFLQKGLLLPGRMPRFATARGAEYASESCQEKKLLICQKKLRFYCVSKAVKDLDRPQTFGPSPPASRYVSTHNKQQTIGPTVTDPSPPTKACPASFALSSDSFLFTTRFRLKPIKALLSPGCQLPLPLRDRKSAGRPGVVSLVLRFARGLAARGRWRRCVECRASNFARNRKRSRSKGAKGAS